MHLHILNSTASLSRCQSSISDTDSIILIEDAVVLSASIPQILSENITVYALTDDLKRRGISAPNSIKEICFTQFVDLCAAHAQCLSW
ncbi:sulfurtransferase complex subunit TusB [Zhongshania aliphaticivorans]|uniref:sulfurtransferase complex subunit TusB n=1 Tax=Zhongshania aliphaticivorans TaxID=1470434 RepID=UPI0012E5AC95|nr:Protein TusB [Zhongshania aliphaticivorans]